MYTVRCYTKSQPEKKGYAFYVLNRGYNSGRPSFTANANCFIVLCETEQERLELFYTCKALHFTGRFKRHLMGSVVELIRIDDFKDEMKAAHQKLLSKKLSIQKAVDKLDNMETLKRATSNQLRLIDDMQKAYMFELFIR